MQDTSKMSGQELLDYRIRLIRDAQAWKKPDRMPINANMFNWMFLDAGYTVNEAYRDYAKIDDALVKFVTKYKVDQVNQLHTGFRNCFQLCDALGGSAMYTSESDNMNAKTEDTIRADEYDLITQDFERAMWTKALPRLFPKVKEMSLEEFAKASKSLLDFNNARAYTEGKLRSEYGIICDAVPVCSPGVEGLFSFFRGIKGLSVDMRRNKEKLDAYCEVMDAAAADGCIEGMASHHRETMAAFAGKKLRTQDTSAEDLHEGQDMTQPYDCCLVMLSHTIFNRKQFEKYLAPAFKKVLDFCENNNRQSFVYAEGSWEAFGDFFNDYSKGVCNIMTEQDDPFENRKKYPNVGIYGGLDVGLMGQAGKSEECVAMAKRAIDELGAEGGLVLMPNKMVSYAYDMNSENLKEVCDFVSTYEF